MITETAQPYPFGLFKYGSKLMNSPPENISIEEFGGQLMGKSDCRSGIRRTNPQVEDKQPIQHQTTAEAEWPTTAGGKRPKPNDRPNVRTRPKPSGRPNVRLRPEPNGRLRLRAGGQLRPKTNGRINAGRRPSCHCPCQRLPKSAYRGARWP